MLKAEVFDVVVSCSPLKGGGLTYNLYSCINYNLLQLNTTLQLRRKNEIQRDKNALEQPFIEKLKNYNLWFFCGFKSVGCNLHLIQPQTG